MGRRGGCCDKSKVKRGSWSPQEDEILKNYIHKHGIGGTWIALPHKAGLERCGKSCRLRWLNYLRPNIKHGGFTHEEEFIISNLFNKIGSRWSIIASHLPGRTDNEVKNYWNTKLKKRHVPQFDQHVDKTAASQIVNPTNLEAPMPFPTAVSNELVHFSYPPSFILEGSMSNNMNSLFCPSLQDSSQFSPFCIGMEGNSSGVKIEEYSCGVSSKEEETIEADCNADLFTIFHADYFNF